MKIERVRMEVEVYTGDESGADAEAVRVFLRDKVIEVMRRFPTRCIGTVTQEPAKV